MTLAGHVESLFPHWYTYEQTVKLHGIKASRSPDPESGSSWRVRHSEVCRLLAAADTAPELQRERYEARGRGVHFWAGGSRSGSSKPNCAQTLPASALNAIGSWLVMLSWHQ